MKIVIRTIVVAMLVLCVLALHPQHPYSIEQNIAAAVTPTPTATVNINPWYFKAGPHRGTWSVPIAQPSVSTSGLCNKSSPRGIDPVSGDIDPSVWAACTGAGEVSLSGGSGSYGNSTNFPTGSVLVTYKALSAGHFTQLTCNNDTLAGGSCSTAPTVNIADNTTAGVATLLCSASAQSSLGTTTTGAQTLTFVAGDILTIYVSTQGATCVAPIFGVTATISEP